MSTLAASTITGGPTKGTARPSGNCLLAFLIVVAFLLCHGVFGASHLLPGPEGTGTPSGDGTAPAVETDGSRKGHADAGTYFATLMLLSFAAALALPIRDRRPREAKTVRRSAVRRLLAPPPRMSRTVRHERGTDRSRASEPGPLNS